MYNAWGFWTGLSYFKLSINFVKTMGKVFRIYDHIVHDDKNINWGIEVL